MEQLIRDNRAATWRIVRARARTWHIPDDQVEDLHQTVLEQVYRAWKPGKAKDPKSYFLSMVFVTARRVIMKEVGYHNGSTRQQSPKAAGEQITDAAGLFQSIDGDSMLSDERILQTVPSAEDVYMATVPSKRQEALRATVQALPEPHRTALTQQFYEELSLEESALKMGMSKKQVSVLRSSAVKMMKRRMGVSV